MHPENYVREELYHVPVEKVWQALTDKDTIKKWYFDIPDFELRVGAVFNFYEPGDARQFHHQCTIKEIIPLQKLQHTWTYPDLGKGISVLTWELSPDGDNTQVRLTHEGLEAFADLGPAFTRQNFEAGWKEIMGHSLRQFLEG